MPRQRLSSPSRLRVSDEYDPALIPWSWRALAAVVFGSFMIWVLAESPSARRTPAAEPDSAARRIDINFASQDELESLPGIGPALAREIVAERPFSSVAELSRVRGIGAASVHRLLPLIKASQGRRAADNR